MPQTRPKKRAQADYRWRPPVDTVGDLPATGNTDGDRRTVLATEEDFEWDASTSTWVKIAGPGAVPIWENDVPPAVTPGGGTAGSNTETARGDHTHNLGAHGPSHGKGEADEVEGAFVDSEPMGFPNRTDTTISFDDGTKIFSIAPTGASFDVWVKGKKFTKPGAETKDISGSIAEGLWFFYYDENGVLQASQTIWDLSKHAPVALIYWDNTDAAAKLDLAEERHGLVMDWRTHEYLHLTVGTRFFTGLAPGGFSVVGDGSADSHAQLSVGDGQVFDEDIPVEIKNGLSGDFRQELQPTAKIPVYFRYHLNGLWRKRTADTFPLIYDGCAGLPGALSYNPGGGADECAWNDLNAGGAGVWGFTKAGVGKYVAMWVFATNNLDEPVIAVLGQREDSTLEDAQNNNSISGLALGSLPSKEMKVLFRLIFQTDGGYGNTPHARLRDVQDLRSVSNLPSGTFVPDDHNSLANRNTPGAHQSGAVSADTTNFDKKLGGADTDVQKALETLDDHIHDISEVTGAPAAGDTVVSETAFGQGSVAGASGDFSRKDHTHGTPTDPVPNHVSQADPHTQYQKESEKDAASGYCGLEADSSIGDTRHGDRGKGTLHEVATAAIAGFMSAADKTKLNAVGNQALNRLNYTFGDQQGAGVEKTGAGYELKRYFWFPGTTLMGKTTLTAKLIVERLSGGNPGSVRVYDVTNAQTICEDTNLTQGSPSIITPTVSNLPSGGAVFRLDLAGGSGTKVACYSLDFY